LSALGLELSATRSNEDTLERISPRVIRSDESIIPIGTRGQHLKKIAGSLAFLAGDGASYLTAQPSMVGWRNYATEALG